jgi:hypothetical protein
VSAPAASIRVGVLVERRTAASKWADLTWRAVAVLAGEPAAAPWTAISGSKDATVFYAGTVVLELYPSETASYRYNLESARPLVWVRLRTAPGEPPYALAAATVDPAEGESFTEAGDDLVDAVAMPEPVRAALESFVAEHHVERSFEKRRRDRADPEALSRRLPIRQDRDHD